MSQVTARTLLAFLVLMLTIPAVADEGMWPPNQLPQLADRLSDMGLKLDPARMTDLTGHPMNAVISLGGCTASFVSPDGLAVTNHHCAYRSIQYNSTEENNLLENGFLAATRDAELFAGPGSRVLVTVDVDDVTEKMLKKLNDDMSGLERYEAIETRRKALVADCEKDEGHRCGVRSFHGGLEYYLIKALEIRDVRLVHAPAGGVGNYGGDIDNWQWPRHTGDYSFYRAYVGPDGKPADHAEENVPFKPKHWLKVSAEGVRDGEFVMVAGYPARTGRYRLAAEVENRFEWYYPVRRNVLERALDIVSRSTEERPDAAIKYAGMVAGLNNATKNYQGMLEGYAKGNMLQRKRAQEDELRRWAAEGGASRAPYAAALDALDALIAEDQATRERDLYLGRVRRGSLVSTARTLYRLSRERQLEDADREEGYQERDWRSIGERLRRLERTFDPQVDRALLRAGILAYAAIPVEQHVPSIDTWFGIEGNRIDEAALDSVLDKMYADTKLGSLETRLAWFEADAKALEKSDDPFVRLAVATYDDLMAIELHDKEITGQFNALRPRYLEGLIAWKASKGEPIYPDANGTLRVTVGNVGGYAPRDGVFYTPFTTVEGILERDTGEDPFDAPTALLDAVRKKRHGDYADPALGSVPVDFLSNVDTTGGNSGSPTLNGRGELVGLLFDGVYESIIADWDFLPDRTRSIHVDIRYVLWVMSQVDGADNLLREMGLAVTPPGKAAH